MRKRRDGIALPLTLVVLALLGALTAILFLFARVELLAGRATLDELRAREAAEAGWLHGLRSGGPLVAARPVGDSVVLASFRLPGGSAARCTIQRIGPGLALLLSEGMVPLPGGGVRARATIQVLAALSPRDTLPGAPVGLVPLPPPSWISLPRLQ